MSRHHSLPTFVARETSPYSLLRLQTKSQVSANEVSLVSSFFTISVCKGIENIYIVQYLLLMNLRNHHF